MDFVGFRVHCLSFPRCLLVPRLGDISYHPVVEYRSLDPPPSLLVRLSQIHSTNNGGQRSEEEWRAVPTVTNRPQVVRLTPITPTSPSIADYQMISFQDALRTFFQPLKTDDPRLNFYTLYKREATEYDVDYVKKYDEDLNTTLIFVRCLAACTPYNNLT